MAQMHKISQNIFFFLKQQNMFDNIKVINITLCHSIAKYIAKMYWLMQNIYRCEQKPIHFTLYTM